MTIRVADYITQSLRDAGVNTIFLLSGGGMMHLVDAAGKTQGIRYVCHHHEQSCAMAADGYARQKGALGACYATSGPGGTNTITGIVGAWQDSTPTIFVTGQSKTSQTIALSGIEGLRQFGTFEVDIVPMVRSVTKYAVMITDPNTTRYHVEKAIHLAMSGRPGPVLLDIPLNIQGAQIDPATQQGYTPEPEIHAPAAKEMTVMMQQLRAAKRPVILAGYGVRVAGATEALKKLAETWNIPVVTSQLGKDVLAYDHPLFVGHSGPKGDRAGNFALQTADLILSIGCSLHSQTTGWEADLFAPNAFKILVDLDEAVLKRQEVKLQLKVRAGGAETLAALAKEKYDKASDIWPARCREWKSRFAVKNEPHKRDNGINFYDFAESLSNALKGHETIVTDAGSAFYVMGQAFRVKEGQRFLCSGSLGTMGFAVPAGIGAALADPTRQIVSITGDGSLMTNVHDLGVMSHERLNLKLFVINNEGYVSIRNTQRSFFAGHQVGTDSESGVFIPKMADLARTFNLPLVMCDKAEDLAITIAKVMSMQGPVLCEIVSTHAQELMPSVTSIRLEDGRMQSQPIHNMSPIIPPAELAEILKMDEA